MIVVWVLVAVGAFLIFTAGYAAGVDRLDLTTIDLVSAVAVLVAAALRVNTILKGRYSQ